MYIISLTYISVNTRFITCSLLILEQCNGYVFEEISL